MAVNPYAQILLWANNAQSTLAGSISNSTTTIALQSGGGAAFPDPSAGQGFPATLTDRATGLLREIVLVTAKTGDTMTVVRAQEGTTGLVWAANDLFAQLVTAGGLTSFVQGTTAQAQGWNYGVDEGAANAYQVNLVPAVTVPRVGMPFKVAIVNDNTGPSTMNYGAGVVPIVRWDGTPCIGGELLGSTIGNFTIRSGDVMLQEPAPATAAAITTGTDDASYVTPAQLAAATTNPTPTGALLAYAYAGATEPTGWLFCNAQAVSRATYADLFTLIGTTFGSGNGSTTFNLPDLRGRVIAGLDNMGGVTAAGRLTTTSMTPNGTTLGAVGGVEAKTFAFTTGTNTGTAGAQAGGLSTAPDPHTHSGNTTSASILQPTMVMSWLIKT